jgi:hypothetical protein
MKNKFAKLALIVAASAVGTTTAFAHQDYSETQIDHWLSHVSESGGQPTAKQLAPFGYSSSALASRELQIDGASKVLNVTRFETVRLNAGGKSVTWTFDTVGTSPFSLSNVVAGADGVTVYVSESPDRLGG